MKLRVTLAALGLSLLCTAPAVLAQPRFVDVAGHDFGERITVADQAERWLTALAGQSDRVSFSIQGRSWEGRPLMLAVITSPDNHARIEAIQDVARRMDDPRLGEVSDAEKEQQPVIVWLGGSIHGFELSGTEGLLKLVQHLALGDDEATRRLLEQTVVLIDPMLNPDGRDAFAHRNHQAMGRAPTANPQDWANDFTRWEALQFRTGHYFFDTNRDWFAHTQRETRERMPTFRAWRPQVMVDAHEMGPDTEFFFDPPTDPVAPYFPAYARAGFEVFGAAYVRAFDRAGVEYTTRDIYNYFYPGFTTSWGSYQGAVGMLYEQGSTRGLALERSDGTVRTLADALENQYLAALTAVRTAADNRANLLTAYAAAARAAIADGSRGVRRYVVPPTGDPQLTQELAALLERNGIEVQVLTASASLDGLKDMRGGTAQSRTLAPGTLVIEAAQPRNRLIRTLLEPHLPIPEEFLALARERIERAENPRFYDVTAYSLPLLFNLPAYAVSDNTTLRSERWQALVPALPPTPAYAWLIDGRQAGAAAAAARLRMEGMRVSVATRSFNQGDTDFARGTVIVRSEGQGASQRPIIATIATELGLTVRGANSGIASGDMPALGAAATFSLKEPAVALLGEHPVLGLSYGFAWHALEAQYGIPVTTLRTRSIASLPLERYTTLVIPELDNADELTTLLGDKGKERLKRWVSDGGTLVALGSGADWVRSALELGALRDWHEVNKADEVLPQKVAAPGAFVRAELDQLAWLSAGVDATLPVLVNSDRVWLAPASAPNANKRVVARYAAEDPRIAGHLWQENLERLPGAVFVYEEKIDKGRVIQFAEDPNFRGYWRGADRLFLNAVLLAPSAP